MRARGVACSLVLSPRCSVFRRLWTVAGRYPLSMTYHIQLAYECQLSLCYNAMHTLRRQSGSEG